MPAKAKRVSRVTPTTDSGFPCEARTNKATTLIRLGSTSERLGEGHKLTVFAEDGQFGTVNTIVHGELMGGSVLTSDYDCG
jgi:hypothetical protein